MQKRVNFVVTDLDDTIWDWLSMWHGSFNPFLERISIELGIDKAELKKDFKQLHQKYGTTEASFIIEELKLLNAEQREKIYEEVSGGKSIMHEYYSNKKSSLKIYDGVLKTLTNIKSKGAIIVGFTESHSFYTKYRLKVLNLDGLIDCIYAPIDSGVPASVKRHYPEGYWEPEKTEFRYLAREVKKPNAEILEIILKDFNATKDNSIYIGDKLDRDIYMAQQANITSVYAQYGHKIVGTEYDLLRDVTHWTEEDVEREIKFKENYKGKSITPDVILENSFNEIEKSFEFYQFERPDKKEGLKNTIEIWKKVIDVQQHFNDIELRIRNYALTLFTATVAGIGLLEKENIEFQIWDKVIPASALLSFAGIFVLLGFWYMDRYWYHKLLLGAVKQGAFIEKQNVIDAPELGLTKAIGESSPQIIKLGKKNIKIHSSDKYWVFYGLLFLPLIILTIVLFLGHQNKHTADNLNDKSLNQNLPQAIDTTKGKIESINTTNLKQSEDSSNDKPATESANRK